MNVLPASSGLINPRRIKGFLTSKTLPPCAKK